MRKALVRIGTPDGSTLEACLRPETTRPLPRTRVNLKADDEGLVLHVEARDTSALRAALNSYLRWSSAALKMIEEARR